ncbi:MAG: GTPase Era [Paracoccaceae bacterium]|nr:GTPase Era [Paracoccaceae bacterium]
MTGRRCGSIALIGEPNAGKSTLMNRIIGYDASVVTHKAQTTRFRVRGIATVGNVQLVFVDTPGLFRARRPVDRGMIHDAWSAVWQSDLAVLLVDVRRGVTPGIRMILDHLTAARDQPPKHREVKPGSPDAVADSVPGMVLAINKIDQVRRTTLLRLSDELNRLLEFEASFMISARTGSGVPDLTKWLRSRMPNRSWLFPPDQLTDLPLQKLATEVTRKHALLRLHQELPYRLQVDSQAWETQTDRSLRIEQVIRVARSGHRGIVLGPKGQTIRAIGAAARAELRKLLDAEVHLFLEVRVKPPDRDRPITGVPDDGPVVGAIRPTGGSVGA